MEGFFTLQLQGKVLYIYTLGQLSHKLKLMAKEGLLISKELSTLPL